MLTLTFAVLGIASGVDLANVTTSLLYCSLPNIFHRVYRVPSLNVSRSIAIPGFSEPFTLRFLGLNSVDDEFIVTSL